MQFPAEKCIFGAEKDAVAGCSGKSHGSAAFEAASFMRQLSKMAAAISFKRRILVSYLGGRFVTQTRRCRPP